MLTVWVFCWHVSLAVETFSPLKRFLRQVSSSRARGKFLRHFRFHSCGILFTRLQLNNPDFQTRCDGHDSTCHDSTLITWRVASQSAMRSETVREKSGRQGKLSTQEGHKCNEARIPTNAFYLKRKALLPGKRRHDTENYDNMWYLEFDCRVRMYLCRQLWRRFHNDRNIINTAKS